MTNKLKSNLMASKILLVEDEESIRFFISYYFDKKGQSIVSVQDAESALDYIYAEAWDVVICDYDLPQMNGIDFLRQVSRIQPSSIKILITGYSKSELGEEADSAGIDKLVQKPFNAKDLLDCLNELS